MDNRKGIIWRFSLILTLLFMIIWSVLSIPNCNVCKKNVDVNLVCLWDSNTITFEVWFPQANRFSNLLNWASSWTWIISTINSWVSWDTTSDVIARLSADVYAHKDATGKRNVVFLLIWTNDFQLSVPLATAWANLQTIISWINTDGWELLIWTYPVTDWETAKNNNIRALNTYIRDNESLWYTMVEIHDNFVSVWDIDENISWYMLVDWLHFSTTGHSEIYSLILEDV
jgi:lysophospholipase L1-like esterase